MVSVPPVRRLFVARKSIDLENENENENKIKSFQEGYM
jgi:hypothetical protein